MMETPEERGGNFMKRSGSRLLAGILTAALLAACMAGCNTTEEATKGEANTAAPSGENASGEDRQLSDTFTFVSTEPNTLNMIESQSNLDEYVFYLTSAMLYRSVNGELVPELCDTMEVSEDGCTYTYTIKDAVYSDGTKITADDFVYYLLNRYLTSENYFYFVGGEETYTGDLDTCEGIYAVDDKTFVVTLTEPVVIFDGMLEIYPLNKEFAEEKGSALGGTPADLMYSGPYILTDWVVGSSMTFEKNDSYINADTMFPVEHVNMVVSSDASTTYSMFANGEVDAIVSVNDDLKSLIGEDNCVHMDAGNLKGLEFNTTGYTYTEGDGFVSRGDDVTALMKNDNFRKALCYALDREAIVAAVAPDDTVTNRYVSSYIEGVNDSYINEYELTDVVPYTGDQEKAKEYLNAALEELGYTDVSQLPTIKYLIFENENYKLMAETMVSEWKSVLGLENIEINLQPIQSAVMSMVYQDFDIYYQSLTLDRRDYLTFFTYWSTDGSVSDPAGFQKSGAPTELTSMHANSEYDQLVNTVFVEFDDDARFQNTAALEQMLYSDFVYFPIASGGGYYAVQDYVEGYVDAYYEGGYGIANLKVYAD